MKPVTRLWLPLLVFCYVTLASAQSRTDSSHLVAIDSGVLEGVSFGSATDEVMFLGIPYAAPPTGERRWTPPQPVEKWQGTRKANAYGAVCPQADDPDTGEDYTKEMVQTFEPYYTFRTNEDCLYLNVFTTNLPMDVPAKKLPVMFWIHGNGNVVGASQYAPHWLEREWFSSASTIALVPSRLPGPSRCRGGISTSFVRELWNSLLDRRAPMGAT